MQKVLITGENSYIGNAVQNHLEKVGIEVAVLDLCKSDWKSFDFSQYDCVFHVAGIAHDTSKKKDKELYHKINYELAIETANKAKESGVHQFIFMSSILIYSDVKDKVITDKTIPKTKMAYGNSKLQADLALQEMNSASFKVAIIRPPMIFGKDCKGNFPRLVSLALKAPFFPKIKNQRSMLHINNLCAIIEKIVLNSVGGIFFPQNPDYFSTTEMTVMIADYRGKKLKTTRVFNWLVWLAYPFLSSIKKLFGNLVYDKSISNHFSGEYQIKDNKESIKDSI